jgi:hypothetical protein
MHLPFSTTAQHACLPLSNIAIRCSSAATVQNINRDVVLSTPPGSGERRRGSPGDWKSAC